MAVFARKSYPEETPGEVFYGLSDSLFRQMGGEQVITPTW